MQYIPNLATKNHRVQGTLNASGVDVSTHVVLNHGAKMVSVTQEDASLYSWQNDTTTTETMYRIYDKKNRALIRDNSLDGQLFKLSGHPNAENDGIYVGSSTGKLRTRAENAELLASDHPIKSLIRHWHDGLTWPEHTPMAVVTLSHMSMGEDKARYGTFTNIGPSEQDPTEVQYSDITPPEPENLVLDFDATNTLRSVDSAVTPYVDSLVLTSSELVGDGAPTVDVPDPSLNRPLQVVNSAGQDVRLRLKGAPDSLPGPNGFIVPGFNVTPNDTPWDLDAPVPWDQAYNQKVEVKFVASTNGLVPSIALDALFDGSIDAQNVEQVGPMSWRVDLNLNSSEVIQDVQQRYDQYTWVVDNDALGTTSPIGVQVEVTARDADLDAATDQTAEFYVTLTGRPVEALTFAQGLGLVEVGIYGIALTPVPTMHLDWASFATGSAGSTAALATEATGTFTWSALLTAPIYAQTLAQMQAAYDYGGTSGGQSMWTTTGFTLTGVKVATAFTDLVTTTEGGQELEVTHNFLVQFTGTITDTSVTEFGVETQGVQLFTVEKSKLGPKARVLAVGGGGSGGFNNGGGGGAGGFVENEMMNVTLDTDMDVAVGQGGASLVWNKTTNTKSNQGNNGTASQFGSIVANGGGGGGTDSGGSSAPESRNGANGASGGGSAREATGGSADASGQGNNGGSSQLQHYAGGGGGGAGSVGADSTTSTGGQGGGGKTCNITGNDQWYAAGGNGGNTTDKSELGSRTNGIGGTTNEYAAYQKTIDAINNTGSGGGGYTYFNDGNVRGIGTSWNVREANGVRSGKGGDGVIVVRVRPVYQLIFDGSAAVQETLVSNERVYKITGVGANVKAQMKHVVQ